jgi:PAS domain S-box-containing protein
VVLENRLSRGVFTEDRLGAVELIAGQLAVSLDNALAERFRSLVQRSSDLTLVCHRDGPVSYASTASTAMLGIDDAALTGRTVFDLVHEDDRAALTERMRQISRDAKSGGVENGGEAEALECRAVTSDGSFRAVEMTFTDLLADPAVGGIVVHLRDVTERRRLETDLRHAQKLESVGQLSAGIAHEINTPIQFVGDNVHFLQDAFDDLNAIVAAYRKVDDAGGAADTALALQAARDRGAACDVDYLADEVPRAIHETLDGVDRVATIVRAMKAFGHPGADTKNPADLNEAIRNTLIVANSEIKDVADVATDLADLPPVWCNLGDINQVLLNLIVNAAHAVGTAVAAGQERGTITVRTRSEDDHTIVIEIQDTGIGIPPENHQRVFDAFFTTKAVGVGTGQGLTMAYSLVHDHHDGTLTLTSDPGHGTTFTVRLPQGAVTG